MSLTNVIDHLRGESDHAVAVPTSTRPAALESYVRHQHLDAAELAELEQRIHQMRDELDEPI